MGNHGLGGDGLGKGDGWLGEKDGFSPRDSRVLFNREGPKGLLIFLDTLVCVV